MDLRKEVLYYDALVDFPTNGQENKLYLNKADGALYYWDGSAYALAGDGSGGVTSVTASSPLASSGGATPNITIAQASGSTNGFLSSTDWTTFNNKQNTITLTTTGTSGAATLVGSTLNIPQYAGGLTYFTEAQNTSSPNATVPVDSLTAVSAATNADFAIVPKGYGAILADIPDNTATGGNKRGQYAIDLSTTRGNAANVASGNYSVLIGQGSQASGTSSTAIGQTASSTGEYALSIGMAYFGATASNMRSIAIGARTVCSGQEALAIGGGTYTQTTASGSSSIAIGTANTASGGYSTSIGADWSVASGYGSYAFGFGSNTHSIQGRQSRTYYNTVQGDCQKSEFFLSVRTTGNTATTLTVAGGAASSTNQVILTNQSAYRFKGTIIGKQSGSTNVAAWDVDGLIVRGANAAATTLVVSNVNVVDNTPTFGTPTLAADTTNGGLRVQVTGVAATNIQWTAIIETTEVIYA